MVLSTLGGCSVILPEVGFLICVNVSIRFLISQDHLSLTETVFRPFDGWDSEILFQVFTCLKFKMVEEQIIQIFSKAILMLSVSAKLHLHFCEVKHQCWL